MNSFTKKKKEKKRKKKRINGDIVLYLYTTNNMIFY